MSILALAGNYHHHLRNSVRSMCVKFPGAEPTNNRAERLLRPLVAPRKYCYDKHSAAECEFIVQLLTLVRTPRLHQRSASDYLAEASSAHRVKQRPWFATAQGSPRADHTGNEDERLRL